LGISKKEGKKRKELAAATWEKLQLNKKKAEKGKIPLSDFPCSWKKLIGKMSI